MKRKYHQVWGLMAVTTKMVEKTFEALFALEDLREVWRRTVPFHNLTKEQKEEVKAILNRARRALDEIEGEIK
ncbi:MAG: hypothetical protein QW231_06890 [Candidatus Bathyarchaeia archaeon]